MMEQITLRDRVLETLKEVELDILREIDRICRKHDIKYSLGGGTCLGQYRHGGIIPWDDDVDLDMVGDNYDRFIQAAMEELDSEKFFLRCRQTVPSHLRTSCRVEMKNTGISIPAWDKANIKSGVFVDIFRWSYLPDDEAERRRVASRLFFLRCAESHLMFGTYANKLKPELRRPLRWFAKTTPIEKIFAEEEQLTHICGDQKTNWIIDDAIINGDHGGYPADGIDEYVDVEFEGITVMNKRNSKNFLSTIYGPNFYKWLPPASRISHHQWTHLDLGEYARRNNLPEDYACCMTHQYNEKKLLHMQKLTVEMFAKVDEICAKHGLIYYVLGLDAFTAANSLTALAGYWKGPGVIGMPRDSYDRFARVCQEELGRKYRFQSWETSGSYCALSGKISINTTHIREPHVPLRLQDPETDGFFIHLVPLEPTFDLKWARKVQFKLLRKVQGALQWMWRFSGVRFYAVDKAAQLSISLLFQFGKWTRRWCPSKSPDWLLDGSGGFLQNPYFSKESLGSGTRMEFCGKSLVFPETYPGLKASDSSDDELSAAIRKAMLDLSDRKEKNDAQYRSGVSQLLPLLCESAKKTIPQCHLNYLDQEENQLSIWRYDEKNDRYLSNQELLGFE